MEITKSIFVSTIEAIQRETLREENLMNEILDHFPNLKKSGNSPQNLLVRQLLDLLRLEFPREENGFCDIEHYCFATNFGKIGDEVVLSIDDLWERLDDKRRNSQFKFSCVCQNGKKCAKCTSNEFVPEKIDSLTVEIVDLSKELYLTCGDSVLRVTDFASGRGFGSGSGIVFSECSGWSWYNRPKLWRKSTPQEIESMLIKKLEADGLKVGCMVDRSNIKDVKTPLIQKINKIDYTYYQTEDKLSCDGWTVYQKGKFAKIIPQEEKSVAFAHPMSEEPIKDKFSSFDGTNQLNSNQNVS